MAPPAEGYPASENRSQSRSLRPALREAVLYRAKTGLPERFGPWKTVYNRFYNWARKGHWEIIFKELQLEVDEVGSIVDGSVLPTPKADRSTSRSRRGKGTR